MPGEEGEEPGEKDNELCLEHNNVGVFLWYLHKEVI